MKETKSVADGKIYAAEIEKLEKSYSRLTEMETLMWDLFNRFHEKAKTIPELRLVSAINRLSETTADIIGKQMDAAKSIQTIKRTIIKDELDAKKANLDTDNSDTLSSKEILDLIHSTKQAGLPTTAGKTSLKRLDDAAVKADKPRYDKLAIKNLETFFQGAEYLMNGERLCKIKAVKNNKLTIVAASQLTINKFGRLEKYGPMDRNDLQCFYSKKKRVWLVDVSELLKLFK